MDKIFELIVSSLMNWFVGWITGILKFEAKVRADNKEIQKSTERYEDEIKVITETPGLTEKSKNELLIQAGRDYINRRRGWYTNGSL